MLRGFRLQFHQQIKSKLGHLKKLLTEMIQSAVMGLAGSLFIYVWIHVFGGDFIPGALIGFGSLSLIRSAVDRRIVKKSGEA